MKNISLGDGRFGEVSFDGKDLFYLYLINHNLYLNHIRDGELLIKNQPFPVEATDESRTIRHTHNHSLSLRWWYDIHYILSGKQRVRVNNYSGRGETKEVFFMTKVRVDGYQEQYAMD